MPEGENTRSGSEMDSLMGQEYVSIMWVWEDVQELRPDWSDQQCQEALVKIAKPLRDRSIELGWEVMEALLDFQEREG